MPKYTIVVRADHTGTGHSIEFEAATPWLALEKSHARFGWLSAELIEGNRTLARVDHLPPQKKGIWQISGPRSEAA
jgi:hypothetical protein